MRIKILKRKKKTTESSKIDVASGGEVRAMKIHPAIWTFAVIVLVILLLNIFGNLFFNNKTIYVSVEPREPVAGAMSMGVKAPDFILSNTNNGRVSNSNFSGSPLIILFWATWNQLSIDQLKVLDKYVAENSEGDVKVLAINSQEDINLVSSFIKRGGYRVPVALDTNGAVGEQYGAYYLPALYIIDGNGIVRDSSVGYINEERLIRKLDAVVQ